MNAEHLRRQREQVRREREASLQAKGRRKSRGKGFNAIAGMASLKTVLCNEVIRPILERDRFEKFGIPLLNGILLYGPPGCGKTFVAERLIEEVGCMSLRSNPSDLASQFVHGGQEKIGDLFKTAQVWAPCIVFIDEIDAIIPSRADASLSHHYAAEVNEFLAQLDNCGEKGVFVIGTTNRPEKIDTAALRSGRFDKVIYVPPPDLEARGAFFKLILKKRPVVRPIKYCRLAELTPNYVTSDLQKIVIEACRKAELQDALISTEMIEQAIRENRPSISEQELKKYNDLNEWWNGERFGGPFLRRHPIGFASVLKT